MWLSEFPETSIAFLVIKHWVPGLIVIVFGGLFASILFPRWQDRYLAKKTKEERRHQIAEDIAAEFNLYVTQWRRLIDIAGHETELIEMAKSTDHLQDRKREIVSARGATRDRLMASLSRYCLYCAEDSAEQVRSFMIWDEKLSKAGLSELPSIEEWRRWETLLQESGLRR